MALVLADRVKVTTTTTGTGAVALGAAQDGYQDFSVLSDGDTTYYCIVDHATGAWEVGLGTYASAGPSLARTSVLASSTGSAVSFGAGPKDVFITLPAERVVTTDGADFSGPVTVPAGASGAQVPRAQEIGTLANAQLTTHYKRSNILGTVSQSGGVPTGAIIERGSNANGSYVRFADGTQICTHAFSQDSTVTTTMGSVFYGTNSWTFPATFVGQPSCAVSGTTPGQTPWINPYSTSGSSVGYYIYAPISVSSSSYAIRALAIGRWF